MSSPEAPVAAQYLATFLRPEMLHVYRQINGIRAFRPVVFCQKRENSEMFPFSPVVVLPKPRTHQLRRFVVKQVLDRPITIYRTEARRILAALHAARAEVLHVYFGHIGVHLLPLLEICDLPVIVSFHGADAQVDLHKAAHLEAERRMFALATLVLARSDSIAARLLALGAPPEKIRLHRTGLNFENLPRVTRTAPADGAWRCLQAGRLIAKKGLRTTLRAFAAFSGTYPQASLTIAGEGPELASLQELTRLLGIESQVRWTGFLRQDELSELFARAHFFLHPSEVSVNGDQEGVPNAMLEAMATGLPILATRHGGIPEAVEEGVSGILVDEGDDFRLSRALLHLAGQPGQYAAMAEGAARSVRARYDLGPQCRILESYYRDAISAKAAEEPRPSERLTAS